MTLLTQFYTFANVQKFCCCNKINMGKPNKADFILSYRLSLWLCGCLHILVHGHSYSWQFMGIEQDRERHLWFKSSMFLSTVLLGLDQFCSVRAVDQHRRQFGQGTWCLSRGERSLETWRRKGRAAHAARVMERVWGDCMSHNCAHLNFNICCCRYR